MDLYTHGDKIYERVIKHGPICQECCFVGRLWYDGVACLRPHTLASCISGLDHLFMFKEIDPLYLDLLKAKEMSDDETTEYNPD